MQRVHGHNKHPTHSTHQAPGRGMNNEPDRIDEMGRQPRWGHARPRQREQAEPQQQREKTKKHLLTWKQTQKLKIEPQFLPSPRARPPRAASPSDPRRPEHRTPPYPPEAHQYQTRTRDHRNVNIFPLVFDTHTENRQKRSPALLCKVRGKFQETHFRFSRAKGLDCLLLLDWRRPPKDPAESSSLSPFYC